MGIFALFSLTTNQAQNDQTANSKTAVNCTSVTATASKNADCCNWHFCPLKNVQKFCQSSTRFFKSETPAETATVSQSAESAKTETTITNASLSPFGCCKPYSSCCKVAENSCVEVPTTNTEAKAPVTRNSLLGTLGTYSLRNCKPATSCKATTDKAENVELVEVKTGSKSTLAVK